MDAQAGLGLYCYKSPDWFSQSRSNCYMCHLTMAHIRRQDAKFDYRARPFSLSYVKVNMVFIELYKTRVTHIKYTEGK